jgi:hypothetical protein
LTLIRINKIGWILLALVIAIYPNVAFSGEIGVVYVDIGATGHDQEERDKIKLACDLLGIHFRPLALNIETNAAILASMREIKQGDALIISGRTIQYVRGKYPESLDQLLQKRKILITVDSETDKNALNLLLGTEIRGISQHVLSRFTEVSVFDNKQVARELGGLKLNLNNLLSVRIDGFEVEESERYTRLIEVTDRNEKWKKPVFVKLTSPQRDVFFLASWTKLMSKETDELVSLIPYLMFIKYAFGNQCWHGENDYANLTIDDPWLREPYGYIHYEELGKEAQKMPFHVTIAFIPYNYNKSQAKGIEIFRYYSDQLSLSIHGNNHNFSEFRKDPDRYAQQTKEIHPDEKNILQALSRMERMHSLTGLPYDRVMIFPRGAYTRENLRQLKKNNFLMTINSMRPHHAGDWQDSVERLRGITLQYESFPMVLRYGIPEEDSGNSEESRNAWIQLRLFLDLPVVLYTHLEFFKDGSRAFNPIAQKINKIQPTILWAGLGEIAKHLYLQKKINETEIEVLAYTSELEIKNTYPVSMKYIIKKVDDFSVPLQSVKINGESCLYSRTENNIKIETWIKPGYKKNIQVLYRSDYQFNLFPYSDSDPETNFIRGLSDFRDNYLYRLPWGNKIVKSFYGKKGIKIIPLLILGIAAILLILFIWHLKIKKRQKIRTKDQKKQFKRAA